MTGKNKCKWCGVEGSKHAVSYRCGSWHSSDQKWSQGIACRDLCEQLRLQHEQTIELLRKRVDAAVAAMDQLREVSTLCGQRAVMAHEVRGIRQALQGNSPEIPEGSE
jgi:hypothetical protein